MELNKQVVSLELTQKLRELGVKQESLFYWDKGKPLHQSNIEVTALRYLDDGRPYKKENLTAAYTVAELISMLQEVAQEDIIVAWSDVNVADHLAKQLCTKLQSSKESAGSGHTPQTSKDTED